MPEGVKQCAQNKKAWHDYFIEDIHIWYAYQPL